MQQTNWEDFRIVLAIERARSLAGAASILGVNSTTVSRRLKVLERRVGASLFSRLQGGTLVPTEFGMALARQAESMEQHAITADSLFRKETAVSGVIRLTTVPFIMNRIIAPKIGNLSKQHPALQISLFPDSRNLSLTRREVDLAIRFAKPTEGGNTVLAQKIGDLSFSAYTSDGHLSIPHEDRPWLSYDSVATHLPQAEWTRKLKNQIGQRQSNILPHDLETAIELTRSYPLKALLPTVIAEKDDRLIRIKQSPNDQLYSREIWLLRHKETRGLLRIETVVQWIKNTIDFH